MGKIKVLLISLSILLTLVIIGMGIWLWKLNTTITTGLRDKHFLNPVEYYSDTKKFLIINNVSSSDIELEFTTRNYRSRSPEQKLFPGDYSKFGREECAKNLPSELSKKVSACLIWQTKETADTDSNKLQLAAFNESGFLIHAYQGNPLQEVTSVFFEPELIAQYLGSEPIMQNYTTLGEFPTACLNSILAIEDSKFLEHAGVSYTGIARAFLKNIFQGRMGQGGSTITQQMVKNYFLTSERTLKRKATEFFMSLLLEAHASKDEILETYLNIIYLGQNGPFQVRGFPAASQFYFQKPIQKLGVAECSMLSAVVANPGLFNPFRKETDPLIRRKALVLDKMKALNFISDSEYQNALSQKLPVNSRPSLIETAPYYIDAVQKELRTHNVELNNGGKIFTGLSMQAQHLAQEAVRSALISLENDNKKIKKLKESGKNLEGMLISIESESGLINALVGGRGYRLTQFNRATDGHRQIGSIMKPFVFLAALMNRKEDGGFYSPNTILHDEKFTHVFDNKRQKWSPDNYGKKYFGDVPMYFALKKSLNAATASLGLEVGLDNVIEVAQRLGVESRLEAMPALLLGAFELYPREVAQAYLTINRMGSFIPITTVKSVQSSDGQVLYQRNLSETETLPKEEVAALVSMMKQTVISGSAAWIHNSGFKIPAAGKTGTTSDSRDAWFAGFTPQTVAVTWVGYDDNTEHGLTGASGAVPIWLNFMKNFAKKQSTEDFAWPETTEKIITRDPETNYEVELIVQKNLN